MRTAITIYPTNELKNKIKELSQNEKRSMNNFILKIIEDSIKINCKHKK